MDDQSTTDLSYLHEITMGDDEIVIKITEAFLRDMPASIKLVQHYFKSRQLENLYKQVHKLKPSLTYMGMEQALEYLLLIEQQAKTGQISASLEREVRGFVKLCSRGADELREEVQKIKSKEEK